MVLLSAVLTEEGEEDITFRLWSLQRFGSKITDGPTIEQVSTIEPNQ